MAILPGPSFDLAQLFGFHSEVTIAMKLFGNEDELRVTHCSLLAIVIRVLFVKLLRCSLGVTYIDDM
jgi:hypothetical protein